MSDSSSHGESQPLIQVAEQQPQALTQVLTQSTQPVLQWLWWFPE